MCEVCLSALGAYTAVFGMSLEDENIHAPDEFFRLSGSSAASGRGRRYATVGRPHTSTTGPAGTAASAEVGGDGRGAAVP